MRLSWDELPSGGGLIFFVATAGLVGGVILVLILFHSIVRVDDSSVTDSRVVEENDCDMASGMTNNLPGGERGHLKHRRRSDPNQSWHRSVRRLSNYSRQAESGKKKRQLKQTQHDHKRLIFRIVDIQRSASRGCSPHVEFTCETRVKAIATAYTRSAADEAVVTTVVRTRSQCETFLHAIIEGRLGKVSKFDGEKAVATPQIDSVRDLCRKLLNQNSAKNQVGDGMNLGARNGTSSSRETLDPDIAAAMAAAATIDASTGGARSRYLRPSRKKKSERDLSAEFAFCAYLENILQILLEISTTRNSVLLADFLGITSTAVEDDSREFTAGGYRAENCFGLIQKKVKKDEENLNKKMKQCVSEGDGTGACQSHFSVNDQYRDTLPPLNEWPDRPVIVRCSEDLPMKINLPGKSAYGALPINDNKKPIPFETPLFKGVAMVRIADLPSSPIDYFGGKVSNSELCFFFSKTSIFLNNFLSVCNH